jgi:hypothetical protein
MAITYTIPTDGTGNSSNFLILKIDENGLETYIPKDPANSDYQAYLASLEAPQA